MLRRLRLLTDNDVESDAATRRLLDLFREGYDRKCIESIADIQKLDAKIRTAKKRISEIDPRRKSKKRKKPGSAKHRSTHAR